MVKGQQQLKRGRWKVLLTQEMLDGTKTIGLRQEEKLAQCKIPDTQGLKPESAYHYKLPDGGTGGPP